VKGFSKEDFDNIYQKRPRKELKNYRVIFDSIERKAEEIISNMGRFSYEEFEEYYFQNKKIESKNDLFTIIENNIKQREEINRYSTAGSYKTTKAQIEKYTGKSKLSFQSVTPSFLKGFEDWLFDKAGVNSPNTVGIYMRNIRIMYNQAIRSGVIDQEYYPFGKGKYQIPKLTKKTLKALTKEEVKLIDQYETVDSTKQWVRDMWIFSYLSNGMNIADIAQIENKQITKDGFEFVRKKTKETAKSNLKSINVAMQPRMMEIIERWGNPPEKKYLFPILDEEMDEETMDLKVRNLNNLITKKIKDIAEECEIDKKVTAVYARHSFATVLRNSGASIEYISEALGHNNVSTTMHYLAKFDSGVVKKWSAELL
jgi:site-specific recombinase XerD